MKPNFNEPHYQILEDRTVCKMNGGEELPQVPPRFFQTFSTCQSKWSKLNMIWINYASDLS
jgi:hypothetical protein